MTIHQLIFILFALVAIGSALFVVTTKNLFHAALMLIVSFFVVAGFYVLLEAGFFAVAQVMVYIGAISILMIFAVMLTRGMMGNMPRGNMQQQSAALLAGAIFVVMLLIFSPFGFKLQLLNATSRQVGDIAWQFANQPVAPTYIEALGRAFTDPQQYAIPFELASVLIVLAMIGAIFVARERRPAEVIAEREELAREESDEKKLEDALVSPSAPTVPETAMAAEHH
jgi:NADH-quinone oxidoreductase subunit J